MWNPSGFNSSSSWSEFIICCYPEALTRTYTVPPIHFNRVPYSVETVPGTQQMALIVSQHSSLDISQPSRRPAKRTHKHPPGIELSFASPSVPSPPQILWPMETQILRERVQESDIRDDAVHAHIIHNLAELGKHRQEVMFILSQYNAQNYLNKIEFRTITSHFPHPTQLNTLGMLYSRGEFDVLIIHRHRGILLGEVKSAGFNHGDLMLTEAHSDALVCKRLQQSLTQLARLETVIRHLVADIVPHLPVRTTVFLPMVKRAQVQRILAFNPQLEQHMCQVLGAADGKMAVQLICCSDDTSDWKTWWDVTPADLTNLTRWWQDRMSGFVHPAMTDEVYLNIVARFVGPASSVRVYSCAATRVEVRTEEQAVAELGSRLTQLVLTPPQMDLLSRQPQLVYLTGPPGTGKTIMLVLKGVSQLNNNTNAYVVSTNVNNMAVSMMIAKQLKYTTAAVHASQTPIGQVQNYHFDFMTDSTSLHRAVKDLSAAAEAGACVIMDEVVFDTSTDVGQRTYSFVQQLIAQFPGLHLWCAGVFHHAPPPAGLQVEVLTTPLRNAPAVLREVKPTLCRLAPYIHVYSDSGIPAPGDGPSVLRLLHQGTAHAGRWPVDCLQCGRNVTVELRQLGVGVRGSGVQFRDVFILTRSSDLQDEIRNEEGEVTSQASGIIRGIREEGIPVCVLSVEERKKDFARWRRKLEDMATAATDAITAAFLGAVQGLERKIVVCLPDLMKGVDELRSGLDIDAVDRIMAVTRCTTQLVVVDVPQTLS